MSNNDHKFAILLADVIQSPDKPMKWHAHTNENRKAHHLSRPFEAIKSFQAGALEGRSLLRRKVPNFFNIGFKSQAFIDVKLGKGADADHVRSQLNSIPGIIMVYSVFGAIDFHCKVVGIELRDIEAIAKKIRDVEGVETSVTNVVIDDTDHKIMLSNWSEMIRDNAERLELGLKKVLRDNKSSQNGDQPSQEEED